jgi:hypothetical protein
MTGAGYQIHDNYGVIAFYLSLFAVASSAISVWQFLSGLRHGLKGQMIFRVGPEGGDDDLLVTNASSRPASVYYVSLDWVRPSRFGRWCPLGRKVLRNEFNSEDEFASFVIPSSGTHLFKFTEASALGSSPSSAAKLCLRLWIVGRRREIWIWLT